jgi:hypothetical protein
MHMVDLLWSAAADDVAGADVRYNLYRRESTGLTPVATRVAGTQLTGAAVCSGTWGGTNLPAGTYIVRAVDWAGNEDTNNVPLELGNPCRGTTPGTSTSTRPQGCAAAGGGPRTSSGAAAIAAAAVLLLAGLLRSKARRRTARLCRYRTR